MDSDKIHVGFLVHHFVPAGLENFVLQVINHLDRTRFRPFLYVLYFSDERFLARLDPDVPVYHVHIKNSYDIKALRKLTQQLKKDQIQILQIHNWGTFLEGVTSKLLMPSLKLIHVQQGMEYEITLQAAPWKRKVRKMLRVTLMPLVKTAVGCSAEAEKYLQKEWGAKKTELIYNSVDTKKFNGQTQTVEGISDYDGFKICTVGRIVAVKNFLCLFKAVNLLKDRIPNFKLFHIGDNHPRGQKIGKQLLDFVKTNKLESFVTFMGLRNDLPTLLGNFDVFALTSFSEGLSFSLLEAQASGLPAVVTAVGGNPEVVQNGVNGFLVPSDDEQAVADALFKLYENPDLRKKMGQAARQVVEEKFSVTAMVQKYQNLYERVLK